MFVRFRQTQSKLQASLVETRRVTGRVQHEHVGSLGSIPVATTIADRVAFWTKAHERIAAVANRIGPDTGKIMGQLHDRIPMPTPEDQRQLQLENARADERFWADLSGMHADTVQGHKGLVTVAESVIARDQAAADAAAAHAAAARDRIERIER